MIGDRVVITKAGEYPKRWRFVMRVYLGDDLIHEEEMRSKDVSGDVLDWLEDEIERRI